MAKHFDWGRAALDDKVQKYGYEPVSTGFDPREDRPLSDEGPPLGVALDTLKRYMEQVALAALEGRPLPIMPPKIAHVFGEGSIGLRKLLSDPRYKRATRRVSTRLEKARRRAARERK